MFVVKCWVRRLTHRRLIGQFPPCARFFESKRRYISALVVRIFKQK